MKKKKKESKKRRKYLDLARELKTTKKYESDYDHNCNWWARKNPQRFDKGTGKMRNQRACGDYWDYKIIKIGQNTEKSPGDLKRLAVAQTPLKDHQLTLM